MYLLVPTHPGCPGQNSQSRKTVECVCELEGDCTAVLCKVVCCVEMRPGQYEGKMRWHFGRHKDMEYELSGARPRG